VVGNAVGANNHDVRVGTSFRASHISKVRQGGGGAGVPAVGGLRVAPLRAAVLDGGHPVGVHRPGHLLGVPALHLVLEPPAGDGQR